MLWGVIIPFFVTWLIFFVATYVLTEWSQNYLYDEPSPGVPWRAAVGALIFALVLGLLGSRYNTILADTLGRAVILAIVGFAVFTLLYRFNPVHGFAIGVVSTLILMALTSLAVDSLTRPRPVGPATATRREPLRRRAIGAPPAPAPAEKAAEGAPAAP